MAEFFRKRMVSLKRSPQNIPLVLLAISFFVYSLNTSYISDTTHKLLGKNMGFAGFVTMLFSILIFVIFLNAFPKRQKPKTIMLVLLYLMFAVIIFCDIYYGKTIDSQVALFNAKNPDQSITDANTYILKAKSIVNIHAILLIIDAVLVALLPVYSKLLRQINTSINVEDNGQMGDIDISEE